MHQRVTHPPPPRPLHALAARLVILWCGATISCAVTLALLVAYAVLPVARRDAPARSRRPSIGGLLLLVLAWCVIILIDGDKPDWLKGLVALAACSPCSPGSSIVTPAPAGTAWASSFFNFKKMGGSGPSCGKGLLVTLELAAVSAVFAVLIGLVVAILRWLGSPTINIFLIAYVDIFRSIPMIVLMVRRSITRLPYVGITLVSVTATIVALALGYGAYAAEAFRAGIESVHFGQTEAARALGLTRWQTMRLVILPQAIRVVIPPLTGVLVAMLKDTAVASVVASPELLKRAREVYVGKANPTALVMAAGIYLVILFPLARLSNCLERGPGDVRRRR